MRAVLAVLLLPSIALARPANVCIDVDVKITPSDELQIAGWIEDAQGNFVWLALGDRTVEFAAAAEAEGVMVRPFAGDGARVSIGEPAGNDVFLKVAAAFR